MEFLSQCYCTFTTCVSVFLGIVCSLYFKIHLGIFYLLALLLLYIGMIYQLYLLCPSVVRLVHFVISRFSLCVATCLFCMFICGHVMVFSDFRSVFTYI